MRTARLATACVATALAVGLMQGTALASGAAEGDVAETSTVHVQSSPPVPTIVSVTSTGKGRVAVSYTLAAAADVIEYSLDDGDWKAAGPGATSGSFTVSDLAQGKGYSIRMRASTDRDALSSAEEFVVPLTVVLKVAGKRVTGSSIAAGSVLELHGIPRSASVVVTSGSTPAETVSATWSKKIQAFRTAPLPPKRSFAVTVTSSAGLVVGQASVSTKDARRFGVSVWPQGRSNLGAGVPLVVTFDKAVRNKAAVERALNVSASKDIGAAGWFWVDSKKVVFRPKAYWPGNTRVRLTADLSGIQAADGTWGPSVDARFGIGDQVVLQVDLKKHSMKYIRNGKTEKKLRISGGKPGWLTQSGTKILTAKIPHKRLYNPDPVEGWDVKVRWAIRVNDFGEYIHDASWNWRIGSANTSHGCTNLTYSDMQWLYEHTKFGDVAVYTGSRAKVGKRQYLAGYWNYSWKEWKRGSAL